MTKFKLLEQSLSNPEYVETKICLVQSDSALTLYVIYNDHRNPKERTNIRKNNKHGKNNKYEEKKNIAKFADMRKTETL